MSINLNEGFSLDEIYQKLCNDTSLFNALSKYELTEVSSPTQYGSYDTIKIKEISSVLFDNKKKILETSISDLILNRFLFDEIAKIFVHPVLPEPLYHIIFYSMKHSSIKTFFLKNYRHFMPEYDYVEIQNREKVKIYIESFIREFDKFTDVIEKLYNFTDIDMIPNEYLAYLSSLIGYERDDNYITDNEFYRALLKNMIEVYKIKGTNYSIELFLSFLGFNIDISEYWFDKRFFYSYSGKNPYTGETDKNNYAFYLTPNKPTSSIPEESSYKVVVSDNDFCTQKNLYSFNKLISQNKATAKQLLGFDDMYVGDIYTYFKTNVASYNVERIVSSATAMVTEITAMDLEMIKKYVTFLTPIFVQNNIVVLPEPFENLYITEEEYGQNEINIGYITYGLFNDYATSFFSENNSEKMGIREDRSYVDKIKNNIRTIGDIYNLSIQSNNGTETIKVRPKASLYGRTYLNEYEFYGFSWERANCKEDIYEYISDAIFVKYENMNKV